LTFFGALCKQPRPEGRGFQVDIKGVLADENFIFHEFLNFIIIFL